MLITLSSDPCTASSRHQIAFIRKISQISLYFTSRQFLFNGPGWSPFLLPHPPECYAWLLIHPSTIHLISLCGRWGFINRVNSSPTFVFLPQLWWPCKAQLIGCFRFSVLNLLTRVTKMTLGTTRLECMEFRGFCFCQNCNFVGPMLRQSVWIPFSYISKMINIRPPWPHEWCIFKYCKKKPLGCY